MNPNSHIPPSPPSVIDLETQSIELAELLQQDVSHNLKRFRFLSFFSKISSLKDQSSFRSYYLQFESWLPSLTDGLMYLGWDLKYLPQLHSIVDNFKPFASSPQMQKTLEEADERVITAAILTYLYVGEPEQAAKLLGIDLDINQIQKTGQSELEKAKTFLALASRSSTPILKNIESYVRQWDADSEAFSPESIHILLVDEFSIAGKNESSQGLLFTLSGTVRERPYDAEEDRVLLNNQVRFGEGSLFWSLLDGVAATRLTIGQSSSVMGRHFCYQFSLPEKRAELQGNSIGGATAVLAYALALNRYYRTPVIKIGKNTAITGGIQPDGTILPVNSQGLKAKLTAAFFSPLKRVVVPSENLTQAVSHINELKSKYPNRHLAVEGVDTLAQAIQDRNLVQKEKISVVRKSIGTIKRIPRQYYALIIPGFTLLLLLLLFLLGIIGSPRHGQPANCQIEGTELRIFDAEQRFLWSYDFNIQLTEEYYVSDSYHNILIDDVDHDGQMDVIFGSFENDDAEFSGNVWRFDHRGKVVWKRHVGRAISFGGEIYNDHFRIAFIYVRDLDSDGKNEIVQVGYHYPWFPVCLQICDVNGNLISEYWHVGQTDVVAFMDLDKDGIEEIILGGQNNGYGNAVLAVLDFRHIQGCSPQTPGSHLFPDSLAAGTEKYYLRFPRTEFEKFAARDCIFSVQKRGTCIIVAVSNYYPTTHWSLKTFGGMIYYDLDCQMQQIADPALGDYYRTLLATRFGIASENIDMAHYRKIEYWDGDRWTEEPTVNKQWEEMIK